jgi:hypothetical protein
VSIILYGRRERISPGGGGSPLTTIHEKELRCWVCGGETAYAVIGSTNTLGAPDLDTRPPEMLRSTMDLWVLRCPSCGYCAADVSEGSAVAGPTVMSEEYIAQGADEDYPELANRFLCRALIDAAEGEEPAAGWSAVRAAWACDDAGKDAAADRCRLRAIRCFERSREHGIAFANQPGAEDAVLADLHRRAGRFEDAERIADEGLAKSPDELLTRVLTYERLLARRSDRRVHTVAEVP